jgi:flagellar basal-body rod protein FlgB
MDPTRVGLFDLAERRLAWLARRQSALAQNVANADTPGWKPRDIAPFAAALTGSALARTDAAHFSGTEGTGSAPAGAGKPAGVQPDGNAVSLDQELTKIADTETNQALTTSIYQTYLGLFRTALGGAGG